MANYILLTEEQAEHVRGPSIKDASAIINPVMRQSGIYILPKSLLTAEEHEVHREYLEALPWMDQDDPNFPKQIPLEE